MSQHIFHASDKRGQNITVTMGYERMSKRVFCTVMAEDEIVYSELEDPNAGVRLKEVEYYREILQGLGIEVPESMLLEVDADRKSRTGNRVVLHSMRDAFCILGKPASPKVRL